MYLERKRFRLGVAATRRDSWAAPKAFENYQAIMAWLADKAKQYDIELVDMSELEFGDKEVVFGKEIRRMKADVLLTDYEDAVIAAEHFKMRKVDALFFPFCDFGQEEAVAKLAKEVRVPVLIWGPRDGMPEGMEWRPTDTQCGLFAASKVLQRYGIQFTYIENCRLEDALFEKEFLKFIRCANIVSAFRTLRILQFSVRPQQFLGVMVNEGELLERFGIEVVPVTSSELFAEIARAEEEDKEEIELFCKEAKEILKTSETGDNLAVLGAITAGIIRLAKKYRCTAAACECWHEIVCRYGISPCFALGELNERGLPCACEMDIHGAVSSAIAAAANRYAEPSFLADLTIRHPNKDNVELLWHCGPFPKSLKDPEHEGHIAESGQGYYPLKKGGVTILRFDGCSGRYQCFAGYGKSVDGPTTNGNYIWLETEDWPAWEKKFIYGPYIHHVSGVYGDYREEIKEACRYLGIVYDSPELPYGIRKEKEVKE